VQQLVEYKLLRRSRSSTYRPMDKHTRVLCNAISVLVHDFSQKKHRLREACIELEDVILEKKFRRSEVKGNVEVVKCVQRI
jgi:hypothetical protein